MAKQFFEPTLKKSPAMQCGKPCAGGCLMDATGESCLKCLRSVDELTHWRGYNWDLIKALCAKRAVYFAGLTPFVFPRGKYTHIVQVHWKDVGRAGARYFPAKSFDEACAQADNLVAKFGPIQYSIGELAVQ